MSQGHDHLSQGQAASPDDLRPYLLNGREAHLTPEQAETLGAAPIGHSGNLGLESPAQNAQPISHEISAEDLPQTMPFNPKDKKQARTVQGKKRWHERATIRTAAAIVGVGALAATVVGVTGGSSDSDNNTDPRPESKPTAGAGVTPGETTGSTPEVESSLAKFGISVAEYPTAELALTAYFNRIAEYAKSSSDTYDQPGDPERLNAILGEDWESNEELDDWGNGLRDNSVIISTNFNATKADVGTPYEYVHTIDVVDIQNVQEAANEVSGLVTIHETDNKLDTVLAGGVDGNMDVTGQIHVTLVNKNGYWQQVEVDNLNNN